MVILQRIRFLLAMATLSSSVASAGILEPVLCKNRKKVAVIGAGATGLTVAKFLKRQGYEDVTVYEKESSVGGKVKSYAYAGKNYDTGAVLATSGFREILKEADLHNVEYIPFQKEFELVYGDRKNTVGGFLAENYSKDEINKALLRFAAMIPLNPKIATQGLNGLRDDMTLPMNAFLEKYPSLIPLADATEALYVGYGYGFYDETPAIYYLKLLYFYFMDNLRAQVADTLNRDYEAASYYFKNGYQSLWIAFAKELNVKLNAEVTAVKRVPAGHCTDVYITANDQTERFDKVVIATPFSAASRFLDLTDKEAELFPMVKAYNYYSVIYEADFMPAGATYFYRDNSQLADIGEVLVTSNYVGGPAQTAYLHVPRGEGEAYIEQKMRAIVEDAGGSFRQLVKATQWRYFPQVDPENMQEFFNALESLQGHNGTYYASSIMNFETVAQSYLYGKKLAKKHF